MHELSLSQGMLGLIEDSARRDGFTRVRTVWLQVGRLASVELESLRFCFDAVTRGSCAEGATLEIERTPGRAWCLTCSDSMTIEDTLAGCPRCGGHQLQVTGGDEMRVKELEVE
jgi:hydrogenase nickel incorporation protein HypA/HybF